MDQLITLMQRVDLERPGSRLTEPSNGSCVGWCGNFNAMVSRLDRANILQKLGMRD